MPKRGPDQSESLKVTYHDCCWLKIAAFSCYRQVRIFSLPRDHLRLLDCALHGRLSDALAEVARHGGDPELCADRVRPPGGGPSSWCVIVRGGTQLYRFEVNDVSSLGIAAHIHLVDYVDELRADIAERARDRSVVERMDLEGHVAWTRQSGNGRSS